MDADSTTEPRRHLRYRLTFAWRHPKHESHHAAVAVCVARYSLALDSVNISAVHVGQGYLRSHAIGQRFDNRFISPERADGGDRPIRRLDLRQCEAVSAYRSRRLL